MGIEAHPKKRVRNTNLPRSGSQGEYTARGKKQGRKKTVYTYERKGKGISMTTCGGVEKRRQLVALSPTKVGKQ